MRKGEEHLTNTQENADAATQLHFQQTGGEQVSTSVSTAPTRGVSADRKGYGEAFVGRWELEAKLALPLTVVRMHHPVKAMHAAYIHIATKAEDLLPKEEQKQC